MSHLHPDERVKRTRSACRKGRHAYGASQRVGGGLTRRVCEVCGEVTIDLTNADEVTTPMPRGRRLTLTETNRDS